MLIQRPGVILGKHSHFLNMGIRHIAEGKVDGSVAAGYRHGRDRPLIRQLPHPVVVSSCKNDPKRSHALSPSFAFITRPLSSLPSG